MFQFKHAIPAALIAFSALGASMAVAQDAMPPSGPMPHGEMHHGQMEKGHWDKNRGDQCHHGKEHMGEMVEAHIARLHDKIKVTAAQEDQWKSVAQVMRDNAKSMSDLMEAKHDKAAAPKSAVEEIAGIREVLEAHAAGAKKLEDAFTPFYATLSDEQKKAADECFSHDHGHFSREHRK